MIATVAPGSPESPPERIATEEPTDQRAEFPKIETGNDRITALEPGKQRLDAEPREQGHAPGRGKPDLRLACLARCHGDDQEAEHQAQAEQRAADEEPDHESPRDRKPPRHRHEQPPCRNRPGAATAGCR